MYCLDLNFFALRDDPSRADPWSAAEPPVGLARARRMPEQPDQGAPAQTRGLPTKPDQIYCPTPGRTSTTGIFCRSAARFRFGKSLLKIPSHFPSCS